MRTKNCIETFSGWGLLCSVLTLLCATTACLAQESVPPLTLADALRLTLLHHPALRIQQEQVNLQKGVQRQAAGQFDLNLNADASQAHTYRPLTAYEEFLYGSYDQFAASSSATNTSQIALSATKQLRNGIVLSPNITATRVTDNLTNRGGISQGSIQFQITVPLLRGRGRAVVTAQEVAAGREVEAAVFEVNETISNLLAAVTSDYWNVVAAKKHLQVLRDSEARADILLQNTKSLIDADRLPRTDINEVKANRAQRESSRMEAEQRLIAARQQLAVDMGMDMASVSRLPEIADDFPALMRNEDIPTAPDTLERYIQLALDQRPELKALKKREEASQIVAQAARNAMRPQLDVRLSTGVSGLDEGSRLDEYLFSPAHAARGVDVSGGITYHFPPAKDAATGVLQQSNAAVKMADLQYQDAARRTAAAVGPALSGVRIDLLQARSAKESIEFYRNAVDAEREKLRMGVGNIIGVVTLEDHLTGILQSEVQSELEYAQSLVQLRLSTSTIVSPQGQGGDIDPAVFSTLPLLPAVAPKTGAAQ